MDKKTFFKLFMWVFTNKNLLKDTRYVLMAIMEYQNMFKLEETFTLYGATMFTYFGLRNETLDYVINYLTNRGWMESKKEENNYLITINYNKIEEQYEKEKKYWNTRFK